MKTNSITTPSRNSSDFLVFIVLMGVIAFITIVSTTRIKMADRLAAASLEAHGNGNLPLATILALESHRIFASESSAAILSLLGRAVSQSKPYTFKLTLADQTSDFLCAAWSPSGQLALGSADGTVSIWDVERNQPVQVLQGHRAAVLSVAWSQDGRLVSGSADDDILLWDLQSGTPLKTLAEHPFDVVSLAWAEDGRLASASPDGTFFIWDASLDQTVFEYYQQFAQPYSLAWSQDGRLAVGRSDGSLRMFQGPEYEPIQFPKAHDWTVSSVAWSSNGSLASGSSDGSVYLWSFDTGRPAPTFCGYFGEVTSIAWPAGDTLAVGSLDGRAWILDRVTCEILQELHDHRGVIYSAVAAQNGDLATVAADKKVNLYQKTSTSNPCQWPLELKNLTKSEWRETVGALYPYHLTCPNLPGP